MFSAFAASGSTTTYPCGRQSTSAFYSNSNPDSDTCANSYPNTYSYPYSNTCSYANSHTCSDTNADANCYTHTLDWIGSNA